MIKIERVTPDAQASFQRDGNEFPVQLGQLLTRSEFDSLNVTVGELMISIDENEIHYVAAGSIHPTPQQLAAAEIAMDAIFTEEFKAAQPVTPPAPAVPVDEISTPMFEAPSTNNPPVAEPEIVFPKKAG